MLSNQNKLLCMVQTTTKTGTVSTIKGTLQCLNDTLSAEVWQEYWGPYRGND